MRSLARENVLMYLYSKLFNQNDEGLFAVLNKDLSDEDKKFANKLLKAVEENYDKYISYIEKKSVAFKLNRILNLDKCAMLIGMAELDNCKENPVPVAIDEAVKLSAKYSTEKSTNFVNGILGEYAKENV